MPDVVSADVLHQSALIKRAQALVPAHLLKGAKALARLFKAPR